MKITMCSFILNMVRTPFFYSIASNKVSGKLKRKREEIKKKHIYVLISLTSPKFNFHSILKLLVLKSLTVQAGKKICLGFLFPYIFFIFKSFTNKK